MVGNVGYSWDSWDSWDTRLGHHGTPSTSYRQLRRSARLLAREITYTRTRLNKGAARNTTSLDIDELIGEALGLVRDELQKHRVSV